jgi:hypothetical protein
LLNQVNFVESCFLIQKAFVQVNELANEKERKEKPKHILFSCI